ncbi:MAG: hypothetical protein JXB48_11860 [Candidatus Latescibacteria bacterium]|nr:hypothetical protein [Candidatus Latescibacterota bacterium]
MPITAVIYIVAAALVASLALKHRWGFWGFFVISLILTPIIGLIIFMASSSDEKK